MVYGRRKQWEKVEVDVVVLHRADGMMIPMEIRWPDGRHWKVEALSNGGRRQRVEHIGTYAIVYPVNLILPSGRKIKKKLYLEERRSSWFVVRHETAKGRSFVTDAHGAMHYCDIPQKYGKKHCDNEMRRRCPVRERCEQ